MKFLICLVVLAVARAAELPNGPWKGDAPFEEEPQSAVVSMAKAAYDMDDALIAELIPFKMPYKMNKQQLATGVKLFKELSKPLLKSKTLREWVASADGYAQMLKEDQATRMYLAMLLDAAQDFYEGKGQAQVAKAVQYMFGEEESDVTARAIGDTWNSYFSSPFRSLFVDPVMNYVVNPMRSYLEVPFNSIAKRISHYMGNSHNRHSSYRWSDTVDSGINKAAEYTAYTRDGLEATAQYLEGNDNL